MFLYLIVDELFLLFSKMCCRPLFKFISFSIIFALCFWDFPICHPFLLYLEFYFFNRISFFFSFSPSLFLLFFPCLSVFYLSRYFFGTQVYSAVETVICIPIRDYERTGPSGFLTSVVIRTIKKYFLIFPYVL